MNLTKETFLHLNSFKQTRFLDVRRNTIYFIELAENNRFACFKMTQRKCGNLFISSTLIQCEQNNLYGTKIYFSNLYRRNIYDLIRYDAGSKIKRKNATHNSGLLLVHWKLIGEKIRLRFSKCANFRCSETPIHGHLNLGLRYLQVSKCS